MLHGCLRTPVEQVAQTKVDKKSVQLNVPSAIIKQTTSLINNPNTSKAKIASVFSCLLTIGEYCVAWLGDTWTFRVAESQARTWTFT